MSVSYSVAQLTQIIRNRLVNDPALQDVWIKGEISNLRRHSSGHWYFTLKDQKAQLKAVMFRTQVANLAIQPNDGDAVEAHGYVDVYAPQGMYQLYVDDLRPAGVGDLYLQFERLKQQLDAEGLFDAAHKRPLPPFPRRIGVVTSAGAAAFQDVLNVLRRRFPLAEVLLSPTLVQGDAAPPQICAALARLARQPDVDVILLVRGGGSIEDLWAFNDERVARALFACPLPVVTGVGHEIDFTIADFVADHRAPTPSAAAELVTPDIDDLRAGLAQRVAALSTRMIETLYDRRHNLAQQGRTMQRVSPLIRVAAERQRIDDMSARLTRAQRRTFGLWRERVSAREAALTAASPAAILRRGYAIVTRRDTGEPITRAAAAAPGTDVSLRLHDGMVNAHITGSTEGDNHDGST